MTPKLVTERDKISPEVLIQSPVGSSAPGLCCWPHIGIRVARYVICGSSECLAWITNSSLTNVNEWFSCAASAVGMYIRVEWKSLFWGLCLKSCLTVPKYCIRNFNSICEVYGSAQNRWSFGNAMAAKKQNFHFFPFRSQKDAPRWENSKSDLKIEIVQHFTPFLTKKRRKSGKFGYFASFWAFSTVFRPKGGQMSSDLNFETRFGILSSRRNFLTTK